MNDLEELVIQIELHSADGIKQRFANGISPNIYFKGNPLFDTLLGRYTVTSRFKDCAKAFVDYGLDFIDKLLLSYFPSSFIFSSNKHTEHFEENNFHNKLLC
jgi:hypothetical protein